MAIEYTLGIISFFTSIVAGVIGFGGGMLLIAILPMYLNPTFIIPIHGITQLASNSSRMLFSISHVQWRLLPRFILGSLVGVFLFAFLLSNIPTMFIPIAIGLYILLNLWNPNFSKFINKYENFYIIGFLQTGLGLIVGSTGPISISVLVKTLKSNDQIIATNSLFMSISHLAKIPVFGLIGFSIFDHSTVIAFMVFGAIMGSFIGTKLRNLANNDKLIFIIKLLLSAMALKMIIAVITLLI